LIDFFEACAQVAGIASLFIFLQKLRDAFG
jgi:hypothetical protein